MGEAPGHAPPLPFDPPEGGGCRLTRQRGGAATRRRCRLTRGGAGGLVAAEQRARTRLADGGWGELRFAPNPPPARPPNPPASPPCPPLPPTCSPAPPTCPPPKGLEEVDLVFDKEQPNQNRGFGFLSFYNHAAADAARRRLESGFSVGMRPVTVAWAEAKKARGRARALGGLVGGGVAVSLCVCGREGFGGRARGAGGLAGVAPRRRDRRRRASTAGRPSAESAPFLADARPPRPAPMSQLSRPSTSGASGRTQPPTRSGRCSSSTARWGRGAARPFAWLCVSIWAGGGRLGSGTQRPRLRACSGAQACLSEPRPRGAFPNANLFMRGRARRTRNTPAPRLRT